jgi:hypothetical protein
MNEHVFLSPARNLPTLSREALPLPACYCHLYIWIRGVHNQKSNRHTCKGLYSWKLVIFTRKRMFLEQWTATMPPLWPTMGTVCAPVGLKADVHSAFLVNFVIIGENICQHTQSTNAVYRCWMYVNIFKLCINIYYIFTRNYFLYWF